MMTPGVQETPAYTTKFTPSNLPSRNAAISTAGPPTSAARRGVVVLRIGQQPRGLAPRSQGVVVLQALRRRHPSIFQTERQQDGRLDASIPEIGDMAKSFFSTSGPGGVPDDAHSHATQSGMSLEPTIAPRLVTGFVKHRP